MSSVATIRIMEGLGRTLLLVGVVLAALGGSLLVAGKLGIARLPGDIVIRRDNFAFYMPLGLMVLLSLLLTVVLSLIARR
jgi:hypothetical protein